MLSNFSSFCGNNICNKEIMEHISIRPIDIKYPVGHYMAINIEAIKRLYQAFIANVDIGKTPNIDIVVSGSSGCIIGGIFAEKLINNHQTNVKIIYISKKGENGLYARNDVSLVSVNNYTIFVDDVIASCSTIGNVIDKIRQHEEKRNFRFNMVCVGQSISESTIKILQNENICLKIISGDYNFQWI